jgi:ABC-type multidrug transport system ATPase subunit
MQISLENVGKKFNRDWILRKASFTFGDNRSYVITGPNGSGKSTLLQMISGLLPLTEGTIRYRHAGKDMSSEDIFRQIAIAAPYLELIEEFTLAELLHFHRQFKPFRQNISEVDFLELTSLQAARHKPFRHFSSGMKTRVKLGLAFLSDVPLLLLDEPTSNLDLSGITWYQHMLRSYATDRLVIIFSNQRYEYEHIPDVLHIRQAQLQLNPTTE